MGVAYARINDSDDDLVGGAIGGGSAAIPGVLGFDKHNERFVAPFGSWLSWVRVIR